MERYQAGDGAEPTSQPRRRRGYSWYVLGILGFVSVLDFYDRSLISILIEPIERGLHLNDAQIGLLTGIAFALAYGICCIPVARLADKYGRVRILAACVVVWSVMSVLTARAVSFTTMALARSGVALGEAGAFPSMQALVADYFPAERRGTALSLISVCGGIGLTLALAGGGVLNDWLGWRGAFLLSGAPGVLLAVLLWFTVREPARASLGMSGVDDAQNLTLRRSLSVLAGRRSFIHLCIGLAFIGIGAYAQSTWTPAFLMRTYHFSTERVGAYYSAAVGPGTLVSILLGGVLNDWLLRRQHYAAPVWILVAAFGLIVPPAIVTYLTRDFTLAMALTVVTTLLGGVWVAPFYAVVQNLAGPQLRALAAAVVSVISSVIGLSAGPYLAGVLSDLLVPRYGDRSLAVSLCLLNVTYVIGVIHFLLAIRTVRADSAAAEGVAIPPHQGRRA